MEIDFGRLRDSILDSLIWQSRCHRLRLPGIPVNGDSDSRVPAKWTLQPQLAPGVLDKRVTIRQFPMREAEPLDGIIACPTRKHCENGHGTGIVRINSKSAPSDPENSLAPHRFRVVHVSDIVTIRTRSMGSLGFRRKAHLPGTLQLLQSWVVGTSADAAIDRRTGSHDCQCTAAHSFAASKPVASLVVRLTQTDIKRHANDCLSLTTSVFVGALSE
jgi:hypothetical protein